MARPTPTRTRIRTIAQRAGRSAAGRALAMVSAGMVSCLTLSACAHDRGAGTTLSIGQMPANIAQELGADAAGTRDFAPVRVRVHPLSRIERTTAGADRAALHVELLDASGLSVRWPIVLGLWLRDGAGRTSTAWADLRAQSASARAFDPVTRTFVLTPSWDAGDGAQPESRLTGPISAQVLVVLAPLATGQEARSLTASATFGAGARAEQAPAAAPSAPQPSAP